MLVRSPAMGSALKKILRKRATLKLDALS